MPRRSSPSPPTTAGPTASGRRWRANAPRGAAGAGAGRTHRTAADEDIRIREARREDAALVFALIRELAEYEKLADQVRGDARLLEQSLFDQGVAEALVIEVGGEPAGYAIFFTTFSTFECRPGIWLEDIYVRPPWRRRGVGRAVLARIAAIAVERDCARIEWVALDWNEPALRFYEQLGAAKIEEWQALRLEGEELRRLGGAGASAAAP